MNDRTTISTHVLDTALGQAAPGISVMLERIETDGTHRHVSSGVTDADGRIVGLASAHANLPGGSYRLTFDIEPYFRAMQRATFYTRVQVDFRIAGEPQHYHVPLLLSPFGYSTYRGT